MADSSSDSDIVIEKVVAKKAKPEDEIVFLEETKAGESRDARAASKNNEEPVYEDDEDDAFGFEDDIDEDIFQEPDAKNGAESALPALDTHAYLSERHRKTFAVFQNEQRALIGPKSVPKC